MQLCNIDLDNTFLIAAPVDCFGVDTLLCNDAYQGGELSLVFILSWFPYIYKQTKISCQL